MLVSDLESRCSARELIEWGVFWSLERSPREPDVVNDLMKVFGVRNG
jgi:hypothetical protein